MIPHIVAQKFLQKKKEHGPYTRRTPRGTTGPTFTPFYGPTAHGPLHGLLLRARGPHGPTGPQWGAKRQASSGVIGSLSSFQSLYMYGV